MFQSTGDVLFAAGTVAYLGAFPEKERQKQIVNWLVGCSSRSRVRTFEPSMFLRLIPAVVVQPIRKL